MNIPIIPTPAPAIIGSNNIVKDPNLFPINLITNTAIQETNIIFIKSPIPTICTPVSVTLNAPEPKNTAAPTITDCIAFNSNCNPTKTPTSTGTINCIIFTVL